MINDKNNITKISCDHVLLVIGASGFIGKNIFTYFQKKGYTTIGTYNSTPMDNMYKLDLTSDNLEDLSCDMQHIKYAVISSAIALIDKCKEQEKESYDINVKGTIHIINQLFERNIFPIFLSSDQVFDGKTGNYSDLDERNPITIYGKHKKIVEDFLLSHPKKSLIVRLSKTFDISKKEEGVLSTWIQKLIDDGELLCATDQILSPTYVKDVSRAIYTAINNEMSGCYNVCSPEAYSRYELASKIKTQLGIKTGKIVPCHISDFNFTDARPLNTSLDPTKFINETNFEFTRMHMCIDKLGKKYF